MPDFNTRYASLDHWRGIAALGVVVFHGFGSLRASGLPTHTDLNWLREISDIGWFGVHLFFVLSGYCIAANAYQFARLERGTSIFLRDRLLRIYPTYWVACLIAIAIDALAHPFNQVPADTNHPVGFPSVVGNLLLIEPYLDSVRPILLVSWSLVYEIGFYFFVAIGLALFRLRVDLRVILAAWVILGIWGAAGSYSGLLQVLNFWPEFLAGGAVFAAILLRPIFSVASAMLLLVPTLLVVSAWMFQSDDSRLFQMAGSAAFAIALFGLHRWDERISGWRCLSWLSWIGTISYSVYLIHVPLGGRVINLGLRWIPADSSLVLLLQILYWIVSLLGGYALYRFCENPINNWRRSMSHVDALLGRNAKAG